MSKISVIGLGAMGTALAQAQLRAVHDVTVWNRTPQKMESLAALGAKGAVSVEAAVQASPLVMICIDSYATTKELLYTDEAISHLSGRTVIQFSTGTPQEARDSESRLADRGAEYLDGAIMCYPDRIGTPKALILVGGKRRAFDSAYAVLEVLGGDLRYLGENIAAAAALDLALLSNSVGLYIGVVHGANICETEGVGLDVLASIASHGERPREIAEIIHAGAFDLSSLHSGASLDVWEGVVRRLQTHARDAGSNAELPDFLAGIYRRALDAGYGNEDIAALIKALRSDNKSQS